MSVRTARIVIASTRAAAGVYTDRTGPIIADWLAERGFAPVTPQVVPDGDPVGAALRDAVAAGGDDQIDPGADPRGARLRHPRAG